MMYLPQLQVSIISGSINHSEYRMAGGLHMWMGHIHSMVCLVRCRCPWWVVVAGSRTAHNAPPRLFRSQRKYHRVRWTWRAVANTGLPPTATWDIGRHCGRRRQCTQLPFIHYLRIDNEDSFFFCLFVRSQWNSITNAIPFCYVVCCEEWRRNVCVEQHNAHSYSDTLSTFRTKYKTQDACYLYIHALYCSCIWSKKVDGEWWGFDTPSLAFSFVWCMTMCYVYISAIIELLLPYQISETLPGCTGYAILWLNIQWVFLFFFFVFFFIFFLL